MLLIDCFILGFMDFPVTAVSVGSEIMNRIQTEISIENMFGGI